MNIPEKAVLAMIEQLGLTPDEIDAAHVNALEAAYKFIAAQALRDAAEDCNCGDDAELLDGKADAMEECE